MLKCQLSRYAASDLGLHCLFMSHKKDARLIWVNLFIRHMFTTLSKRIIFCIISMPTTPHWVHVISLILCSLVKTGVHVCISRQHVIFLIIGLFW